MVTKGIHINKLSEGFTLKSTNTKEKRINIRVSNEEYTILKGKAKDADVSVSTFIREIALKGRVNYLDNGKEIARQIGTLHGKMEMYHQDISNKIQKVQKTLEESNQILQSTCGYNHLDTSDIFKYQKKKLNVILDTMLNSYEEHERNIDSRLQQITSFLGG